MPVNAIGDMGVQSNGDIRVIRGDDYSGNRKLRFDDPGGAGSPTWGSYIADTATFTIGFPTPFTKAAVISDVGGIDRVDVEPISAETKLWPVGLYPFDIQVQDSTGPNKDVTLVRGYIEVLVDYTATTT